MTLGANRHDRQVEGLRIAVIEFNVSNNVRLSIVALIFGLSLVDYFLFYLFFRHIKKNYSSLYRDMGNPSLYKSLKTNKHGWWPVFSFLFKRRYKNFEGPYFHKISFLLSCIFALNVILCVLLVVLT